MLRRDGQPRHGSARPRARSSCLASSCLHARRSTSCLRPAIGARSIGACQCSRLLSSLRVHARAIPTFVRYIAGGRPTSARKSSAHTHRPRPLNRRPARACRRSQSTSAGPHRRGYARPSEATSLRHRLGLLHPPPLGTRSTAPAHTLHYSQLTRRHTHPHARALGDGGGVDSLHTGASGCPPTRPAPLASASPPRRWPPRPFTSRVRSGRTTRRTSAS